MRIYLFVDNRTYSGTAVEIVSQMAKNANFINLPPEDYMVSVSKRTKINIQGETFEERCKSFVTGLLQNGLADIAEDRDKTGNRQEIIQGPPVPPSLKPSDPRDDELYRIARKELEKFFPSELFIRLMLERCAEMKTTYADKRVDDIIELFAKFLGLSTKQISEFKKMGDSPEENRARAETECKNARFYYIIAWAGHLRDTQERRMADNLWPQNTPEEYFNVLRHYLTDSSASQVMTQFAENIKTAVDASPDGLLIMPHSSKGIELRIKKNASGYYLA